jgi:hypothetical protein
VADLAAREGYFGSGLTHLIASREELASGLAHLFVHYNWARIEDRGSNRILTIPPTELDLKFNLKRHGEKGAFGLGVSAVAFVLEFGVAAMLGPGENGVSFDNGEPAADVQPAEDGEWSRLSGEAQAAVREITDSMKAQAEVEGRKLATARERGLYVERSEGGKISTPLMVTRQEFDEFRESAKRDFEQLSRYIEEDPREVLWRRALFRRFALAVLSQDTSPSEAERGSS